ncbi:hypothetical protein EPUS_03961 [Endocarpon pusillum Z07020]|uniref:Uncharacterized protein n=1 Tax=Endocarpon pusillum (strain Z07020 / HMAS-L-300199) TaxID=1263415 RepID=U1GQA2_ENDPU|nr:uncharacterized protein EPUS_03961 [Endocarpon pusillum Z07020]ERF74523.1 hypothetical protein EPUS_03961 [Endocarpon pusillum Z07020]
MEQSGLQHVHHTKLVQANRQLGLPDSPEEQTLRPVGSIEKEDMKHGPDPRQTGAEVTGAPNSFCANSSTADHLIRVDRSEIITPRISDAGSLKHDNLRKLQAALADPTPLARWQSESVKVSAWNNMGECVLGWNRDSVSPEKKEAQEAACANKSGAEGCASTNDRKLDQLPSH